MANGRSSKLLGRLQSGDLSELDQEIRLLDGLFVLELSELLTADEPGIDRLRELAAGGAESQGASHYVEMLLDS